MVIPSSLKGMSLRYHILRVAARTKLVIETVLAPSTARFLASFAPMRFWRAYLGVSSTSLGSYTNGMRPYSSPSGSRSQALGQTVGAQNAVSDIVLATSYCRALDASPPQCTYAIAYRS